jgi:ArsR family transcriptional regulator
MKAAHVNLMFRAFSDGTRLRILWLLLNGEMCVCDLVALLRVPQPTASRHLGYLKRAGLVRDRQEGLWNFYRLAPAKSAFHRDLLKCLRSCCRDVPEIATDGKRVARGKRARACCG